MLHIYSIPIRNGKYVINDQADILDDLLPFRIPQKNRSYLMEYDNRSNNMLDYFTLGDNTKYDTYICYFTSNPP